MAPHAADPHRARPTRLRRPSRPRVRSLRTTGRGAAAAVLVTVILLLIAGGLSRARVETSLDSFLPVDDPTRTAYEDISATFGGDPVVVLMRTADGSPFLQGDRIEQTLRLEGALAGVADVATVYGPATLLNQIAGRAQDLVAELLGRRDAEVARARETARAAGATAAEVRAAGRAVEARFDARYGTLLVSGLGGGLPTLRNQQFVDRVVLGSAGRPRGQWRFVLPTVSAGAVLIRPSADLSAQNAASLTRDIAAVVDASAPEGVEITVTGAPILLTALSERTASDAVRLGALAVFAVGLCFLGATFLRRSRRMAPLATTLLAVAGAVSVIGWAGRPVSVGVVAFCSVLLGIGCYYPTYFALGARLRTVLVVAGATTLSLATLTLSPLPLVRDLGMTMAGGVVLAVLISLPLRRWLADPGVPAAGSTPAPDVVSGSPLAERIGVPALRVATGVVAVVALAGWGQLPTLPVQTDIDHFAGGLPALADATTAEDVIGSSSDVAVVVRGVDTLAPDVLAWQRSVVQTVVARFGGDLTPVLSPPALLDFLGDDVTGEQVDAALRILPEYLTDAVVTGDRGTSALTFGVSLRELDRLDTVLGEVRRALPPPPDGVTVEVTGLPVVLLRSEELVSQDRVPSNLLGIGAATLVLLIGLRRRGDAVRACAAALLATGVSFALVHLLGIVLNPVTVALGALTAAVGCEFTVVQAEAHRRGSAVLGRAVALVALTSTAGYLVLLGSGLEAVRGFGVLLAGAVVIAALCSWLVVSATVSPRRPAASPGSPTSSVPHASLPEAAHV